MAAKKPSKVKQAASRMKAKVQAARASKATKKPKSLVAKAKAAKKVEPVPKGYHTVVPSLTLRGAGAAIDFYKRAFGAKELSRMPSPDGSAVWHAELKIGDSIIFVADEMPGGGRAPSRENPAPGDVFMYLKDADQLFNQAVGAGATVIMPMADQFWGDRMGMLRDPFGYSWTLARRVKNMTPREVDEAGKAFAAQMAQAGGAGSDGGGQVASGPQADQPTPNDLPSGAI